MQVLLNSRLHNECLTRLDFNTYNTNYITNVLSSSCHKKRKKKNRDDFKQSKYYENWLQQKQAKEIERTKAKKTNNKRSNPKNIYIDTDGSKSEEWRNMINDKAEKKEKNNSLPQNSIDSARRRL